MHIRCPHCHNPVEVVGDDLTGEIVCTVCGSSFSLIDEKSTVTYRQAAARQIAHFELVEQLGIGHFGAVWKARDTELDRLVAVKLPRKDQLDPGEIEMFLREARAAAQLRHPGIVPVHEVGRDGDSVYIVSDYIQGANLKEWLTAQRLTPREAAELVVKIATALEHAHASGVIHRDLKPGNILMDLEDQPHIADFGLAKRDSGEITMTVEGRILGTPAYMSPEQARGEAHQADRRADVYSLGVILFELLTGELPFRGDQRMLIVQILRDEAPSPRKLNSRIPRDLETITLKCLQKDPTRRYQTAAELADDLSRYLCGESIRARPVGRVERAWRWTKRQPTVAALLASVATLLIAIAAVSTGFSIRLAALVETERIAREDAEQHRVRLEVALNEVEAARSALSETQASITTLHEQLDTAKQAGDAALAYRLEDRLARVIGVEPKQFVIGHVLSSEALLWRKVDQGEWVTLKQGDPIYNGFFLSLPACRSSLLLTTGVTVTLEAETCLEIVGDPSAKTDVVNMLYGRVALFSSSTEHTVRIFAGKCRGIVTLSEDAAAGFEMLYPELAGADPLTTPVEPTIDTHTVAGSVEWEQDGQVEVQRMIAPMSIRLHGVRHEDMGLESPEANWILARAGTSPIEQRAITQLQTGIADRSNQDNSIAVVLRELAEDRRPEVSSVARRSLACIGDFDPLVVGLNDSDQRAFWTPILDSLQRALARGSAVSIAIRAALDRHYRDRGATMYRMLWGYTEKQLAAGEAEQLVSRLDDDLLAVRVLTISALVRTTGDSKFYFPERSANDRQTSVAKWREWLASYTSQLPEIATLATRLPDPTPALNVAATPVPDEPSADIMPQPDVSQPEVSQPEVSAKNGIGRRVATGHDVAVRWEQRAGQWRQLLAAEIVYPGDYLVTLPAYRSAFTLGSGVSLQLIGPARVGFAVDKSGRAPGIMLDHGRAIIMSVGGAETQFLLAVGDLRATIDLDTVETTLAIEVRPHLQPGVDPRSSQTPLETKLYVISGEMTWHEANCAEVKLVAPAHGVQLGEEELMVTTSMEFPNWTRGLDEERSIDQRAANSIRDNIDPERNIVINLKALASDRRPEVASLAARVLAYLDELGPVVASLNDSSQRAFWTQNVMALDDALGRGTETATLVHDTFEKQRGADGELLYRLLCGYDAAQLKAGAAAELVELLDHKDLDVRVLSITMLAEITGSTNFYRPEKSPQDRASQVQRWRQKLAAGDIVPKPK